MANQILTQNNVVNNLPPNIAVTVKQSPHRNIADILIALTDLYQHGDFDAAALALGDVWLTLATADQLRIIALVRELSGDHA